MVNVIILWFIIIFRKAVRATIVLLPLFGLDWLLTVYRPSNSEGGGCIWPILHRYLLVILSGARGLMVSIVFCYRNGEVIFVTLIACPEGLENESNQSIFMIMWASISCRSAFYSIKHTQNIVNTFQVTFNPVVAIEAPLTSKWASSNEIDKQKPVSHKYLNVLL